MVRRPAFRLRRHRDQVFGIEPSALHQHPLAASQRDFLHLQFTKPRMPVLLREVQKQPLHLHRRTRFEQCLHDLRAQRAKPLEDQSRVLIAVRIGHLLKKQFKDGPLGSRGFHGKFSCRVLPQSQICRQKIAADQPHPAGPREPPEPHRHAFPGPAEQVNRSVDTEREKVRRTGQLQSRPTTGMERSIPFLLQPIHRSQPVRCITFQGERTFTHALQPA